MADVELILAGECTAVQCIFNDAVLLFWRALCGCDEMINSTLFNI